MIEKKLNHDDTTAQRKENGGLCRISRRFLRRRQTAALVVEAAFRVHRQLGPGLLESVYEICLCHELTKLRVAFQRQLALPVIYDGIRIDAGLRLDLLVENCVVVELKAIEGLLPVHEAQILTYLKPSEHRLGLLINFNSARLKDGLKRIAR